MGVRLFDSSAIMNLCIRCFYVFILLRLLVSHCFGDVKLPIDDSVPLPWCAVTKVRKLHPAPDGRYTGKSCWNNLLLFLSVGRANLLLKQETKVSTLCIATKNFSEKYYSFVTLLNFRSIGVAVQRQFQLNSSSSLGGVF